MSMLWKSALLAGAAWFVVADVAAAQAPVAAGDSTKVEEVVVTARRREESLKDVPVAVSAFSAEKLSRAGASDITDLQRSTPNLTLQTARGSNSTLISFIRGIGQQDPLWGFEPGVGLYLDDVYVARPQGAVLDIFDVSRIEVLRGPQGTLYGRNTIGGAVKFVSKPLTDAFGGEAEATVGDYGLFQAKASVNAPLVGDRLIAKAAVAHTVRGGFGDNAYTGGTDGDRDQWAGRLALEWRASPDLTFRLNLDGSLDRPDASRTPARATPVFGYPATTADPFAVNADFADRADLTTSGVSLVADWRLSPSLRLKSITAWRRMTYDAKLDLDATPQAIFGVYDDESQNQESQEFQLSYDDQRLSAVGGVFLFREHDVTYSGLYGPAIGLVTGSLNDQTNVSYAVYGQGAYKLTDRLSLTAGLRYTYENKDFSRSQKYFAATTPFPVPYGAPGLLATDISTSHDWASWSPKLGLDFHWTPDVLAYASVSRGFKSGGFDGRANDAAGAKPYNPETLWAYEVGIKSTLFERRLTANAALFWNDYRDLQLSSFVADAHGGFAALFTNAGQATMRGAELELVARPVRGLTLNLVTGYLDGRYDRYIGPGGVDISRQRKLVNAPRWDVKLGGTYRFDLGERGAITVGADAGYRSKTYPTVSSSEVLAQKGYTLVNAFARYDSPGAKWWLQVGGKNLTDRRYINQGFDLSDSLGYQLAYYGDPRTVSATLGVRF